jgi:acyl-CoA dehydrogenase family member 9
VLSRVTDHLTEHGVEASGQELYICETFCGRAAERVRGVLDQVERNDVERMVAIAKLAYQRGDYGYAFFED